MPHTDLPAFAYGVLAVTVGTTAPATFANGQVELLKGCQGFGCLVSNFFVFETRSHMSQDDLELIM